MRILALAALLGLAGSASANSYLAKIQERIGLRRDTPCGWDDIFRRGTIEEPPCGKTRGTVLYAEGHLPRLKARIQGSIWKGKTFHGDGTFTNRWLGGVQAISATVAVENSWFDGQPCLVMAYPPGTPIFGGLRDELRCISPSTWLARSYDSVTGCSKGYFLLQR
jgi:hypothetical protein